MTTLSEVRLPAIETTCFCCTDSVDFCGTGAGPRGRPRHAGCGLITG